LSLKRLKRCEERLQILRLWPSQDVAFRVVAFERAYPSGGRDLTGKALAMVQSLGRL
jgi:hypothetical protein